MSDQLDIHGNAQPLTWDGEPVYSPDTVREGLFDPEAFEQMRGQLAINPEDPPAIAPLRSDRDDAGPDGF